MGLLASDGTGTALTGSAHLLLGTPSLGSGTVGPELVVGVPVLPFLGEGRAGSEAKQSCKGGVADVATWVPAPPLLRCWMWGRLVNAARGTEGEGCRSMV